MICEVHPVEPSIIRKALELVERHKFPFYDALIVGSALELGCKTLYSEDLQNGMTVDRTLRIVDPFA